MPGLLDLPDEIYATILRLTLESDHYTYHFGRISPIIPAPFCGLKEPAGLLRIAKCRFHVAARVLWLSLKVAIVCDGGAGEESLNRLVQSCSRPGFQAARYADLVLHLSTDIVEVWDTPTERVSGIHLAFLRAFPNLQSFACQPAYGNASALQDAMRASSITTLVLNHHEESDTSANITPYLTEKLQHLDLSDFQADIARFPSARPCVSLRTFTALASTIPLDTIVQFLKAYTSTLHSLEIYDHARVQTDFYGKTLAQFQHMDDLLQHYTMLRHLYFGFADSATWPTSFRRSMPFSHVGLVTLRIADPPSPMSVFLDSLPHLPSLKCLRFDEIAYNPLTVAQAVTARKPWQFAQLQTLAVTRCDPDCALDFTNTADQLIITRLKDGRTVYEMSSGKFLIEDLAVSEARSMLAKVDVAFPQESFF